MLKDKKLGNRLTACSTCFLLFSHRKYSFSCSRKVLHRRAEKPGYSVLWLLTSSMRVVVCRKYKRTPNAQPHLSAMIICIPNHVFDQRKCGISLSTWVYRAKGRLALRAKEIMPAKTRLGVAQEQDFARLSVPLFLRKKGPISNARTTKNRKTEKDLLEGLPSFLSAHSPPHQLMNYWKRT